MADKNVKNNVKRRESLGEQKARMAAIVARLEEIYPQAVCALEFGGEPWRLMVMGRLSAQCTDARVNIVCGELFEVYPTLDALADAPLEDIERIIRFAANSASTCIVCGNLKFSDGLQVSLPRNRVTIKKQEALCAS